MACTFLVSSSTNLVDEFLLFGHFMGEKLHMTFFVIQGSEGRVSPFGPWGKIPCYDSLADPGP